MFTPLDLDDCGNLEIFAPTLIVCIDRADRAIRLRSIRSDVAAMIAGRDKLKFESMMRDYDYGLSFLRRFIKTKDSSAKQQVNLVNPLWNQIARDIEKSRVDEWSSVARREYIADSIHAATLKTTESEKRARATIADFTLAPETLELSRMVRIEIDGEKVMRPNWHCLLDNRRALKTEREYELTRVDTFKKKHSDSSLRYEYPAYAMKGLSLSDFAPTQIIDERIAINIPKKSPLAKLYRVLISAKLDDMGKITFSCGNPLYRDYALKCYRETATLYRQLMRASGLESKMRATYETRLAMPSYNSNPESFQKEVRGKKKAKKGNSDKAIPFQIACEIEVPYETIVSEETKRDSSRTARDSEPHTGNVQIIRKSKGKFKGKLSSYEITLPAHVEKEYQAPKIPRALNRYEHPYAAPTKRRGTLRLQD